MSVLDKIDELQVARLAEVGLNSAALLHEMRQPLTAVRVALHLAMKEAISPALKGFIQDAESQIARLTELLDRAHSFLQPGLMDLQPFAVELVIKRVLRLLEHSVRRKNIELMVSIDQVPQVLVAVPHVEQILFNLINNARDSLVECGAMGRLMIVVRQRGKWVEVVVADDGIGIPQENRSAIFSPYTSTKGKAGSGLGLYVARRLAAGFSGELALLEPGELGELLQPPPRTAMALRLPIAPSAEAADQLAAAQLATPVPPPPPPPRSRREMVQSMEELVGRLDEVRARPFQVALLCRERWIQEPLMQFLQPIKCSIQPVADLQELVTEKTDLIVAVPTDTMPLEEILSRRRGRENDVPVMAVLPHWSSQEARRALSLGFCEALKVPTGNLEVLTAQAAVLAALEEHRVLSEARLLLESWTTSQKRLLSAMPPAEGQRVHEKITSIINSETEIRPEVVVCGNQALLEQAAEAFGELADVSLAEVEMLTSIAPVDLLFLEPAGEMSLSRMLDTLPLSDLSSVVVCAEQLSLREVRHALDRGVHKILTYSASDPQLTSGRLGVLSRHVKTRKQLDAALRVLLRGSLHARAAMRGARRRRILLVDDEQVILKLLSAALQPSGFHLVSCATGSEALEILKSMEVDLLIADKNLPDISGMDVARFGSERHPEMAVLIITGFASQASAEEALRMGVDDYLVKPFDIGELVGKVRQLLSAHDAVCASEAGRPPLRPPTVVLAEPDRETQRLLENVFARRGESVVCKGTPAEMLELVSRQPVGIVVLNVDHDLSDDGRALLRAARESCPEMVLVATAARPDLGRTLEALRLGACALLHKPIQDVAAVMETIADACGQVRS